MLNLRNKISKKTAKKLFMHIFYEIAILLDLIFLFTVVVMDSMVFKVCLVDNRNGCSIPGIIISISSFFIFLLMIYLTHKFIKSNNFYILILMIVIFSMYFARFCID